MRVNRPNSVAPSICRYTDLNKRYPHGLGKVGARDHTSGTPVTNLKRSTKLYKFAMSCNRGLDRDNDSGLREGVSALARAER